MKFSKLLGVKLESAGIYMHPRWHRLREKKQKHEIERTEFADGE